MEQGRINLEIKDVEGKSGVKLVLIDGILDVITITETERILNPLIEKEKYLILDCTNVSFISTTGLIVLLNSSTKLKMKNGSCKIVNPNKFVRGVLDLTGLISLFEVYPTQEEAIKSIPESA